MDLRFSRNQTDDLIDIHLCYKIDASFTLIYNPSISCVLLQICLGFIAAATICGNLLVIISVIYFKQLHTPTNYLILSLAVADLLVGVLVFPLNMVFTVILCLFHPTIFCDVRNFFDTLLSISSLLNICCISVDRYYAVCQPLTYRTKINNRVVVFMILVIWGVATLISIIFTVSGSNSCDDEICLIYKKVANVLVLLLPFYLPVIIMLCIYLKIFLVAQKQARSIQNTKSGAAVSKMERKATKTLAVVMGVFLLCWLPFFLCVSVLTSRKVRVPLPVTETLKWVSLSNSMLNPFIYAFFYSWFKSAFKMVLTGKIFQGDFTNTRLS